MKKITILLVSILCMSLFSACASKDASVENVEPQASRFDCKEFDIDKELFTNNVLLSINLTDNYIATESSNLLYSDPKYYIGEYTKYNGKNAARTISVYEYNDPSFSFDQNCKQISESWYISNEYNIDDDSYIREFYTKKDQYTIGLTICNNDKNTLLLNDSIELMSYITDEECSLEYEDTSTDTDSSSYLSEGSLDQPAQIGEWVNTSVFNPLSNTYEPICISITEAYENEYAQNIVDDYNNLHENESISLENPGECSFVAYKYSVFFPSSFTTDNGIVPQIQIPLTICNDKDNGMGIKGFQNLDKRVFDISPEMLNVTSNSIWQDGMVIYEIPLNSKYFIKVNTDDNLSDIKYFNP